jgi:hypothetical protein
MEELHEGPMFHIGKKEEKKKKSLNTGPKIGHLDQTFRGFPHSL